MADGELRPICLLEARMDHAYDEGVVCRIGEAGSPVSEPSAFSTMETPTGANQGGRSVQWERYRCPSPPRGCPLVIWVS